MSLSLSFYHLFCFDRRLHVVFCWNRRFLFRLFCFSWNVISLRLNLQLPSLIPPSISTLFLSIILPFPCLLLSLSPSHFRALSLLHRGLQFLRDFLFASPSSSLISFSSSLASLLTSSILFVRISAAFDSCIFLSSASFSELSPLFFFPSFFLALMDKLSIYLVCWFSLSLSRSRFSFLPIVLSFSSRFSASLSSRTYSLSQYFFLFSLLTSSRLFSHLPSSHLCTHSLPLSVSSSYAWLFFLTVNPLLTPSPFLPSVSSNSWFNPSFVSFFYYFLSRISCALFLSISNFRSLPHFADLVDFVTSSVWLFLSYPLSLYSLILYLNSLILLSLSSPSSLSNSILSQNSHPFYLSLSHSLSSSLFLISLPFFIPFYSSISSLFLYIRFP